MSSLMRPAFLFFVMFCWDVFDVIHGLLHSDTKASHKLMASKFVVCGLKKDVSAWSVSCIACQKAKMQRHVKASLTRFEIPERRFDYVNIDFVGPKLTCSQWWIGLGGQKMCSWCQVQLGTLCVLLLAPGLPVLTPHWKSPQTTVPSSRLSFLAAVAHNLGIKLYHTTAYHPQADGLCESLHHSIKSALKDHNWYDRLGSHG